MKRIVLMLSTVLLVIFVSGMCVFADTASEDKVDKYDLTTWNFYLGEDVDLVYQPFYGSCYGVFDSVKCDEPSEVSFNLSKDAVVTIINSSGEQIFLHSYGTCMDIGSPEVGESKVIVTGESPFYGKVEIPFEVTPYKVKKSELGVFLVDGHDLVNATYKSTYNGKAKHPKYGIDFKEYDEDEEEWFSQYQLVKGEDYTVSYKYSNNKNVGIGTVYLTFKFKKLLWNYKDKEDL